MEEEKDIAIVEEEKKDSEKSSDAVEEMPMKETLIAGVVVLCFIFVVLILQNISDALSSYPSGQKAASNAIQQGNVTTVLHNQEPPMEVGNDSAPEPFHAIQLPKGERLVDSGVTHTGDFWTKSVTQENNTVLRIYTPNGLCTAAVIIQSK